MMRTGTPMTPEIAKIMPNESVEILILFAAWGLMYVADRFHQPAICALIIMVLGAAKAIQSIRVTKALNRLPLDDYTRYFLGGTAVAFLMALFVVCLSGVAFVADILYY